ncbi:MAG: hypothetical protein AAF108_04005 [Planctomycetota bacterium]
MVRSTVVVSGVLLGGGLLGGGSTLGQVVVEAGQTLTEDDLLAGVFEGQTFSLEPGTVIRVEGNTFDLAGRGRIGPVGVETPFDFGGVTIELVTGELDGASRVENVTIRLTELGRTDNSSEFGDGVTIDLQTDGTVGIFTSVLGGAVVHQTGGLIAFSPAILGIVNQSGGEINSPRVFEGGELNLTVQDVVIDGVTPPLDVGLRTPIEERGEFLLEATLESGNPQAFLLRPDQVGNEPFFFQPGSLLTVTLTPRPCPAEFNNDGVADFFDVLSYLRTFDAAGRFLDLDHDGDADADDVAAFLNTAADGCP